MLPGCHSSTSESITSLLWVTCIVGLRNLLIDPVSETQWAKYNYIVAASFPAGIAIASLVIFFALEIPKGGFAIDWWGNNVLADGCEGLGNCVRYTELPDIGYFGGAPGTY